ncbi:3-hydroxyacyl-CoA dehydrogenase family protein [Megasphaera vaginalis (ex Srinivasan et al. 2021)]|uniref:L-gulonate 3-dehydrogenase n=1 Tax=Megasphaera vaginalis (ex Srinivasan et al. 2021) TaxID=1111454 RepID=U7UHI2_9FIRM|nr:3-hydroxyacyl-CoA dehydrogenase family protein [Megasphaera vaginalis (ex Srinivasan et al. 2021)]ERT58756.1 putative 3-hydroxybutyryl-CoA dehydrogenase [Megasphaera vaginalis (ex Srinivasan et al. 2021)]
MKQLNEIKTICNLGCGTMGFGTAIIFAKCGYDVNMFGRKPASIERAMNNINLTLKSYVENDMLTEDQVKELLSHIHGVTTLKDAANNADFVIESVAEAVDIKQSVYKEIEEYLGSDIILATDSSGLSPTEVASTFKYPERFVVAHFWNPPHLIPLVEVVPGAKTSPEVVDITWKLMEKIGKKPVSLLKEAPGFIGNRLQFALLREALYCVQEGIATPEAVDTVVKYSIGRRLGVTGPIETADLGGLDIFYNISSYLNADLADNKGASDVMKKLVDQGKLGAKTGTGLYNWNPDELAKIKRVREDILIEWLKKDESGQKF